MMAKFAMIVFVCDDGERDFLPGSPRGVGPHWGNDASMPPGAGQPEVTL